MVQVAGSLEETDTEKYCYIIRIRVIYSRYKTVPYTSHYIYFTNKPEVVRIQKINKHKYPNALNLQLDSYNQTP